MGQKEPLKGVNCTPNFNPKTTFYIILLAIIIMFIPYMCHMCIEKYCMDWIEPVARLAISSLQNSRPI